MEFYLRCECGELTAGLKVEFDKIKMEPVSIYQNVDGSFVVRKSGLIECPKCKTNAMNREG